MADLKIITNNVPRDLFPFDELNVKEQQDFDYISDEEDATLRFFRYQGRIYDAFEFVRIVSEPVGFCHYAPPDSPLLAWHGISTDTFFSAVLVKLVGDEQVIAGRCYS